MKQACVRMSHVYRRIDTSCVHKPIPTYGWTQTEKCSSTFSDIFRSKLILNMFLCLLKYQVSSKPIPQQNPSIYMSKNILKWKIKEKLKNEKSLKNLQIRSLHSPKDDHVAYGSMKGTHSASWLHSSGWSWTHYRKLHRSFSWIWVPLRWESLRENDFWMREFERKWLDCDEMRER